MARKEQWSVRELTIVEGGGIRAGVAGKLAKVLRFYTGVPATIVADHYVASVDMGNKSYTIANSGLPGDGLAHNVTVAQSITNAAEDTNGILTVTGKDIDGKVISETIIPNGGATVQGVKAFAQVTSIVGSGWVINGADEDTIVMGFGEIIGLPEKIALAADILLVVVSTGVVNAPTVLVSTTSLANNTILFPTGDATKVLRVFYQI